MYAARRSRPVLSALSLLCVLLVPAAAAAQTGAVLDTVRSYLQGQLVEQHIPGFSVAVVVGDELVWSEGFGVADLESGELATGSTIYRIGSVSKPVVGTAFMQLWEQGKIDLEADIRTYIPQWPQKRWPIRVWHLLTHTSGIRHYDGQEFLSMEHYDDLVGPMEVYEDDPLLFEPGTEYSYSTYGFSLVANIVENVSGEPIDDYMREHVYEPAWMNSTGLEDQQAIQRGRAKWYSTDRRTGRWQNEPYVDLSNKYAGGGITSTVEDLARLHIAYARGVLLEPATIEEMYRPRKTTTGEETGYGLSWRVGTEVMPDGTTVRTVSHSGGSIGANTLFVRYPDQGFAIAIVANHAASLGRMVRNVTRLFYNAGAFGER